MTESFIQFTPGRSVPYANNIYDYYLNPGNVTRDFWSLYTPLAFTKGTCTRFRTVTRGMWGPLGNDFKIVTQLTKNRVAIPESKMSFMTRGDFGVVTRHKTTFPNVEFKENDTIGMLLTLNYISYKFPTFYVSSIANFEHD